MANARYGEQQYKQCNLCKPVDGGMAFMTSWIRSEIAMPGKVITKLEDTETGVWENGWKVIDASASEMPEHLLIQRSHRSNVFGSLEANRTKKDKA